MAKIVFFCRVKKSYLTTIEFYNQDIEAIRSLGHDVIICNSYRQIPFDFDCIFIWWWTYAAWPVLLAKLLRRPSFVTGTFNFKFPSGFSSARDYFHRPVPHRWLIRLALKLSSRNLFVNHYELNACSKFFKLHNSRYFPHVLDADYLQGPSSERELAILNICFSTKNNLLRKGIYDLLKAQNILNEEGIKVPLYMLGHKGDGFDLLRETVFKYGLGNRVRLLGEVSRTRKLELLRRCEIYAQPSHYEGFGLATAEAMGCGSCVVSCKVGAVEEVVGNCGVWVSPGAPYELAENLKMIIRDQELRHAHQECARKRANDIFQLNNKIKLLKQYLSEVGIG